MENAKPMLIFDLDGTLWDASQSLAESWAAEIVRLSGRDKKYTIDEIHAVLGLTMDEIADRLLPEIEPPRRYEIFDSCMDYELEYLTEHGGELFPGTRETLDELREDGYKMAIVSNCQTGYIKTFLDSMNMHEYFCDIEEWGNTGLSKGQNIRLVMERNNVENAVYIGDIQKDLDAATEAGIPCIWAEYGFGTMDKPAGVIHTFSELRGTIPIIGGLYEA